jgi:hypothetical protein
MARLKVVAVSVAVPAGLAVATLFVILAGGFDAAGDETAVSKAALLIRASCKNVDLKPQLPTSLGLAVLRHLRS